MEKTIAAFQLGNAPDVVFPEKRSTVDTAEFCNNVQQLQCQTRVFGGSSMIIALRKAPGKRMKLWEWEQVV
ncbi:hypothetical protein BT69DRAFT_1291100 [Atractiella rhizophila]|nr:hypothetical protein BT69DRAFT_1291100 [Atractiella rhizophila]